MDKVTIDQPRDMIIVEKADGMTAILAGSKLFCGCCGEMMGIASKRIDLPCDTEIIFAAIDDISFEIPEAGGQRVGLLHKTCGKIMFRSRLEINFMPLQVHLENIQKPKWN